MLLKNPDHGQTITIEEMGLVIRPGDVVQIDDAYCLPRVGVAGGTMPSVLEDLCGGRKLLPYNPVADEGVNALQARANNKNRVVKKSTKGLPPGVQDMIASGDMEGDE